MVAHPYLCALKTHPYKKRGQVLPETVTGYAFEPSVMLNSGQSDEECDATDDDSSTEAGQTKKI